MCPPPLSSDSSRTVSAPCVKCPSELHGEAGGDRQALVQRSDSHIGLHVESGGSPSGSRKGFMDKTRVISLSDSGLGIERKKENPSVAKGFSDIYYFIHAYHEDKTNEQKQMTTFCNLCTTSEMKSAYAPLMECEMLTRCPCMTQICQRDVGEEAASVHTAPQMNHNKAKRSGGGRWPADLRRVLLKQAGHRWSHDTHSHHKFSID